MEDIGGVEAARGNGEIWFSEVGFWGVSGVKRGRVVGLVQK